MLNILLEVLSQLQGMWRFRWQALILVWVVCAIGWIYTLVLPDQYRASARVFVNPESALEDLLRGLAVATDVKTQIEVMTRTLLSTQNLEKVARRADLHLDAETPGDLSEIVARLKANARFSAAPGRERNLFTISYTDSDPARAKAVVSAMMDSFVEDSRGANRQGSSAAQQFLDEQIADYERRLAIAERQLADFKKENVGLMPGNNLDYYGRLQLVSSELQAAETEVRVLEGKRAELEKQIAGELPTFGLAQQPQSQVMAQAEDPVLASYRGRLNDLLLQYTDKHPDVLALRETIEQLEQRRAAQAPPESASTPVPDAAGVEMNPVYQNLKLQLSDINVQLVEARARLTEKQKRVAELRLAVDAVPEVEAQMQRLNRDYRITKQRFEALLERREIAKLTEDAEITRDDVRFRIVDPPTVDRDPVFPRRSIFFTVSLLAALGGGAALTFLLNQLKPVFNNRRLLEEACGLPVFGAVERVWTTSERRRLRVKTASFVAALSLLFAAYGLIIVFETPTVDLARSLMQRI